MTKGGRRRWALLPTAAAVFALLASVFVNVSPASADPSSPDDSQTGPVVVAPMSARGVATRTGTDVFITAPLANTAADELWPTVYQVVACGPFALDSVQFNAAISDACGSDPTRESLEVSASTLRVSMGCTPTGVTLCALIVRSRHGDQLSEPTYAASGGVAPNPPKSVSVTRSDSGVALEWTAGRDAKQIGSLPAFATGFEVRLNGRVLADYVDGTSFDDSSCTAAKSCVYSVRTVSAAGRSIPAVVMLRAGQPHADGGPVDTSAKLTAGAQVEGTWVTVQGTATPSGQGATLSVQGVGVDDTAVEVPVNRAGGWSFSFQRPDRGTHSVKVVQTVRSGRSTSLSVDYRVRSVRTPAAAVKVPGAPTKVTAVASGTSVDVDWRAPASNGGATITKYVVVATPGSKTCAYVVPKKGAAANSCTVTGLTYGTAYTFAVKAYNSAGASAAGVSPSVTPKAAPSAPARPTVAAVAGGVTVTWTAPASNGSAITSYKATATPGNATCTYVVPARSPLNSCTITGLTPGVSYTVKVAAKNGVDWSTPSPASLSATVPSPPGAPTSVVAQSMDGAATVNWTPPASTGGSAITSYKVVAVGDATKACTYTVPATGTSANTCTVSGLTNGNSYQFTVVATNVAGDSAASSASSAMVAGAPGPVTDVTVTAENGRATITFANVVTIPSGMNFTNYTVTVDGHPEIFGCTAYRSFTSYYPVAVVAPTTNCTITGLTNGVEYTFSVQANVIGPRWTPDQQASSPAARSNAVTSYAPPGAPRSVTVYSFNGGALLSWEPPVDNGGSAITAYRVTATPSAGDPVVYQYGAAARRVGISGLDSDVRYSVSVTAVTERGTGTAVASSAALFTAKTSAPTSVTAEGGDRSAVVTWTEPSSIPFPILYYTITATDYYGTSDSVTVTADASGATVDGLLNGHTYTFTVTATNGAGDSPASAASGLTLVATTPQPVSAASVEGGNRYATVTWTPVGFEDSGGSSVTQYVITATPASGPVVTKTVTGSYTWDWSSLWADVTALDGLLDGVDYTFAIAAKNAKGTSATTSAGVARSIGAPGQATITSTVERNHSVIITWTAPASDGGAPITQYSVTTSWGSCTLVPSGPGPYSCTVYGLTNGYTLPFTVSAQNSAGSSYSSTVFATPRTSVPDSPTIVSAVASASQSGVADIAWTLNDDGGSTITRFTVSASPGTRTCDVYVSTATSCRVYGLTPGTSYTFTVTATNEIGESAQSSPSESVTALGRPGQPDAPVVRGGPTTATVSFTPPSGNGLPITRYEVTVIDWYAPDNPPAVFGTDSPITVTGLILGHTYKFAVTARNAMGDGFMSSMTDPWVAANKPSAPSITSVTPGVDSVHVAFTTPANGGSPITSYEVTAIDDTENVADTIVEVTSSPAQITGLITGHSYRVTVRATNVAGDSPASIVSSSVVPQAIPGAPSNVSAASTDGGLAVSFDTPSDTGGSAVTGYRVRAHDSVTGADSYATGSSSPIAIGGLVNGRSYVVSVQATKSAYIAGPFADAADNGIPAGVPGAPTSVVAANSRNASSSVSFIAPSGNGASITSYTVTATEQVAPFGVVTTTGTSSPIVITGLTNRHAYRITVAATNRMGTGEATANVGYTTPVAPPGAPTIGPVTATSATSVSVPFVAPGDNGGSAVISYTVTATDRDDATGSRAVVGYGSPIAVTGLVAGDTYTFAVSATNVSATGAASSAVPVAPQQVTGVAATAGNGQAEIAWVIPTALLGEPATYTATSDSGGSCTSTGSTCVITGLTNYSSYLVSVTASNAGGSSAPSDPVTVTPIPVSIATSVPSAPRNVVATPQINGLGDGSATVTWDAPSDSGGGAITGYEVTTSPPGGTCVTQYTRSCVLTGLDPYGLYTVSVVATNSVGSSSPEVSAEVSACGFDSRLARCKWQVANQQVRAEQVDGGVRVSWRYGAAVTAIASPSGRSCTSLTFDPVTLTTAPLDSQSRQYCVISGTFDEASTFRVEASDFDSSSAVHATWTSLTVPHYTRAATPHVTGTSTGGSTVSIVVAPSSCADVLDCPTSMTFGGAVTDGEFDIPLTSIAEGRYTVYVVNPLLEHVLARTTPQTLVVDRTNPTPLTVPVPPTVARPGLVDVTTLGIDYESSATVYGFAECDSVNTFTVTWYAGREAQGAPLAASTPSRVSLGAACWYADTLAGAADGDYTVVVSMSDPSGNASSVSEVVVVDSAAPNLTVSSPVHGETVPSGIVQVDGGATSVAADQPTLTVTATSGAQTITRNVTIGGDGTWSTTLALATGSWDVTTTRSDRAGNLSRVSRSITVADAATALSVAQPTTDEVVAASTTVSGWAIPGQSVVLTSGNAELADVTASADGSWSVRVTLDAGATDITATSGPARAAIAITVGTPVAGITIASPGVGGRTNGRPLTGTGPIGATLDISVDGALTSSLVNADGQWSLPLAGYSVGPHDVTVSYAAWSASQHVVIDRIAPTLAITLPLAATTPSNTVAFTTPSGVSDSSSLQLSYFLGTDTSVDPEYTTEADVSGSVTTTAFPSGLADGEWTLVATRADAAGNVGSAQVTFTYDRRSPALSTNLASIMPGPLTISGTAGTASGDHALTITVDGQQWTAPSAGAFSYSPVPAITSGEHTIVVRQVDDAGNETSRTTSVTVDAIAPNLTMALDGAGATFAGLVITGSATGADGEVSLTATACSLASSPCAADSTTQAIRIEPIDGTYAQTLALAGGYWYVTTTRVDAAGNETTRGALVLVDFAAPELNLDAPTGTLASGALTLAGTTSLETWRDPQVHVAITRVGAVAAAYEADLEVADGVFTATTPVIADGDYDVVVTRDDPVHPATVSHRVIIDTTGPAVTSDSVPDHDVRTYCVTPGTAARDLTHVSFRLALDSASYSYSQEVAVSAGRACVTPPSDGEWEISATQADSLGNVTETSPVMVRFDFTAPVVFVNDPSPSLAVTSRWAASISGAAGIDAQDTPVVRVNLLRSQCSVDCTRTLLADVNADGTWRVGLAGIPEGPWRVTTATQTDAAGNVGTFRSSDYYSLTYSFAVDHRTPSAPTLSLDGPGTVSMRACTGSSVVPFTLTINVFRSGSDDVYRSISFGAFDPAWCASSRQIVTRNWLIGAPRFPNGNYTIVAEMSDPIGNVARSAPLTYVSNWVIPIVGIQQITAGDDPTPVSSAVFGKPLTVSGTGTYNDFDPRNVVVSFTPVSGDQSYRDSLSAASFIATAAIATDGTWSTAVPANLPVGSYRVVATQGAGSATTAFGVTLPAPVVESAVVSGDLVPGTTTPTDTQTITIAGSTPVSTATPSNVLGVDITITGYPGSLAASAVKTCSPVVTGTRWTCTLTGRYPNGSYTFTASTRLAVAYAKCTAISDAGVCTTQAGTGVQRVSGSRAFTLNGEYPQPWGYIETQSAGREGTYGQDWIALAGRASTRAADLSTLTFRVYRRSAIANWPTIVETPYSTSTASARGDGTWSKTISVHEDGRWVVQISQSNVSGLVGYSRPIEFTVDTSPPVIGVTVPSSRQLIPKARIVGTFTGGYGTSAGPSDTSNLSYAQDGKVTYYPGWNGTSGTPSSFEWVSTNQSRTWAGSTNNVFTTTTSLAAGKWTALVEAYDENGRLGTQTIEFEVQPSLLPAAPVITARIDGDTAITSGVAASVAAGYHWITVRVTEKYGFGMSQAPTGWATLRYGTDTIARAPVVNREARFFVPLTRGSVPIQAGFEGSTDNSAVLLSSNHIGNVNVSARTTHDLTATFSYPGGAGGPGVASVAALYDAVNSLGVTATMPCLGSTATVTDSAGKVLGSGTLANGGRFPIATTASGTQNLTVRLADGSECAAASGTFSVNVAETSTPDVSATVADTPIPYVGGDAVINATVATSSLTPLVVGVPIRVEDSTGATVSTATVLTDAQGRAQLHVVPSVAGNRTLTVVSGGDRSGFKRTTTTVTMPVEPARLDLTLTVDSAGTHPGEPANATFVVGGIGSAGVVTLATGLTPGAGAQTLTPALVCTTDCRVVSAFPTDVRDQGASGVLRATYTSTATGRVFTRSISTGRVAWTSATSAVVYGAGPPVGLTAVSGGSGTVNVAWIPAQEVSGSTILGYRVTASVGGLTVGSCETASSSCSISGLTNGTPVLFTAVTRTSVGDSGPVTATAAASASISATASPVAPLGPVRDTVLRDHLVPVSTTVTFPSATAAQLRAGTVTFHAIQSPIYCAAVNAPCSPTRHDVTVDIATGATTDTLFVSNIARGSIPEASLKAAGVTREMLTPSSSISIQSIAGSFVVRVSSQIFVGAYSMLITASYASADTSAVRSSTSAQVARVDGVGAPVIRVDIASANVTGGSYAPVQYASRSEGAERVLSVSGWGVRDPKVGETAYVRATIDPVFGVADDRYEPLALAVSQPGVDPLFASPDRFSSNDRLYARADMWGTETVTIEQATTSFQGQAPEWRRALGKTGLTCATDCMVWAVRNADSTDPVASGGGLAVGTHEIGVMSYSSYGFGIASTVLNVQPWETTQMAEAALTSESAGQKIRVLTGARWTGMAPEVQASMANVMVSVQLTHGATSNIIAVCFYAAVCLSTDGNGTTFLPTEITPISGRVAIEIDPASLGYRLTSADSITVTTSTPWGITAASPAMALRAPVVAVETSGPASVTTAGQWLGGVLQEPETHNEWWWAANDALTWFRDAQHSLWMSIFRSEAVASFLMAATSVALSMIPGYDILTAIACSSWTCVAGALGATVAGPAFAALKAGFSAFKTVVKAGSGLLRGSSAAAAAPGRISRFVTAAKSMATRSATRVTSTVPVQMARTFAQTLAFRISLMDDAYLFLGKFSAQVAVANIKPLIVPASTSFNTIVASYESPAPPIPAVSLAPSDAGFRSSTDYSLYVGDGLNSLEESADGLKTAAWNKAIQDAFTAVTTANPPQPSDVGYGTGVAMQFAHEFVSQVNIALPNLSAVDLDASTVQGFLMKERYDPTYANTALTSIGTCTLNGACSMIEGLTGTAFRGTLQIKGVFPQSVSWIPRGAWIQYVVTVVNRTTRATTVYHAASNIAFPGRAATDVEMGSAGAVTMAHVRPYKSDPIGPVTPWPTGDIDPAKVYSPDTATLTGSLLGATP